MSRGRACPCPLGAGERLFTEFKTMTISKLLRGKRVRLTGLTPDDLPILVRWYQDAASLQRDGQRYDMLLYGLLRPEWKGNG